MKLWIPATGSSFKLLTDWHLSLEISGKNIPIVKYFKPDDWNNADFSKIGIGKYETVTIPADTILSIWKYDIARGRESENRIYFKIEWCPNSPKRTKAIGSFYAYLSEVAQAEIEPLEDKTQRFTPPADSVPSPGATFTFGEFDEYTKSSRWTSGYHRPRAWFDFVHPEKGHVCVWAPVYRDREWSKIGYSLRLTGDTVHGSVRILLNEKVIAPSTPLENLPGFFWDPRQTGAGYWTKQPPSAKPVAVTIRTVNWIPKNAGVSTDGTALASKAG